MSEKNKTAKFERYTVCVLKGEPDLPEDVNIIAGISSDWKMSEDAMALNLALGFNYLRRKLEKSFNCKISHTVVKSGLTITLDDELVREIWNKQRESKQTFK